MQLFDYHIHTQNSADAKYPVREMAAAAVKSGMAEICITDHVDFDDPTMPPCNLDAQMREIEAARANCTIPIKRGVEVGLGSESDAAETQAHLRNQKLDFIIGSLHIINGENSYFPEFFTHRTKQESYELYAETLKGVIRSFKDFNVLGHYDFVAKYAPYNRREMTLSIAPATFDDIFRYLVENGKSMEINTSSWRENAPWGLDVLSRFRELGGEYITTGSDAHTPQRVGAQIKDALSLARAAGIRYVATFENRKPILHKI